MKRLLRSFLVSSSLERASMLRHVSIIVAVVLAWSLRRLLVLTNEALLVLAIATVLNVGTTLRSDLPSWSKVARPLSSLFGLASWAALAHVSGGAGSPFVAGLWLEIIFSALVFPPSGTLLVSAAAALALGIEGAARGDWVPLLPRLGMQIAFLGVIGGVTALAARRWRLAERRLRVRAEVLDERLAGVIEQLDDARALESVAEGMARFSHGVKNSLHSLRGFTKLIETPRLNEESRGQAIEGLRFAIDRLEEMTQATLRPVPARTEELDRFSRWATSAEIGRTLDEVVDEVGRRYRGVEWVLVRPAGLPSVPLSCNQLREIFLVLAENAAEASGNTGEVIVTSNAAGGMFNLIVRDRGPGIAPELGERIFKLGATTKPEGHGYGLFLARRLVEAQGGSLTASQAIDGGARFSVTLPLALET